MKESLSLYRMYVHAKIVQLKTAPYKND